MRVAYLLERQRIQSAFKSGKARRRLLAKYSEREHNRVKDLYHKLALRIVKRDLEVGASVIEMEDLKVIRGGSTTLER